MKLSAQVQDLLWPYFQQMVEDLAEVLHNAEAGDFLIQDMKISPPREGVGDCHAAIGFVLTIHDKDEQERIVRTRVGRVELDIPMPEEE
jgi:hypothetical protein